MAGLSQDEIQGLLSKARTRGEYDVYLKEFLETGEAGIEVDRETGLMAGKSADQIKVGLENAKKRTNDAGEFVHGDRVKTVKVIKKTDEEDKKNDALMSVYLIDTARVEGAQEEAGATA